MSVDLPWTQLNYGSDLIWAANDWATPVTVGNGSAYLSFRRFSELLMCSLRVTIGSTTSMPGGGFILEIPGGAFFGSTTYTGPAPSVAYGVAFLVQSAAPNYVYTGIVTVSPARGTGPARPGCALFFPTNGVGGAGQLTSTFPFTLAVNDYFACSFWVPFSGT